MKYTVLNFASSETTDVFRSCSSYTLHTHNNSTMQADNEVV